MRAKSTLSTLIRVAVYSAMVTLGVEVGFLVSALTLHLLGEEMALTCGCLAGAALFGLLETTMAIYGGRTSSVPQGPPLPENASFARVPK